MFGEVVQAAFQRHDRAAQAGADGLQQLVHGVGLQACLGRQSATAEAVVDGLAEVHTGRQQPQGQVHQAFPGQRRGVEAEMPAVV
ncbi:hypothetical protein D9M70_598730 [compost metagenome]